MRERFFIFVNSAADNKAAASFPVAIVFDRLEERLPVKEKFLGMPPWQQGLLLLTGGLFLVLTVIWVLRVRQAIFSALAPFFAALIIAYLLAPLVNFMESRRDRKSDV